MLIPLQEALMPGFKNFSQIPVLVLSTILVIWKVNIQLPDKVRNRTMYDKVQQIDFLGSSTLDGTVGTLLLGFSLKSTEELPWSHPLIWSLFIASAVCCMGFVYAETNVSPYPVMPMRWYVSHYYLKHLC